MWTLRPGADVGQGHALGDVARLLQADDDRFCVVGPGDEVRLEFEAGSLPPLPSGWTRSYVLRSVRLLQGRRPVHRHERHRGALALAGHARLPVRPGSRSAGDPGPRGVSPRLSDPAGGWGRGRIARSMTFTREEGRSGSRAVQPSSAFRLYSVALISLAAHSA